MITPYKNRTLKLSDIVQVYRNLNNNLFSIKCAKTGLVLAHGEDFMIRNCTPHVSQSGRKRVLDKKQRNVHAWISGSYSGIASEWAWEIYDEVYYNPYTHDEFVTKSGDDLFEDADIVFSNGKAHLVF